LSEQQKKKRSAGAGRRAARADTSWIDLVTPDLWISSRFDLVAQQYQVEVYAKVRGPRGIRHLLWWGPDFEQEQLLREALALGTFSVRPYRLGQGTDGTASACIDALYRHFCAARDLDPEALYERAYQKRAEPGYDPLQTRRLAEWQGLVYPALWGDKEVLKLLHDLGTINNHGLVSAILEALPQLAPRFYHTRHRRQRHREPLPET
jgi:hypothetical protein